MRIPQYEQRIIADPAKRTQVNLKEPETFRDLSSLQRQTKSIEKTANLGADLYLDMKKQRDQGIVDEFTNQYNVEKINKVNELRTQYKGANSTKIVDEFSKWHNDYLATHLGIGPSGGATTLILENDEQIEGARKALADDLPTSINSLSSYAATELNNYRNHQFEGKIYGLADKLSKERDANNIGIYISTIEGSMASHYAGESAEYINMQSKKNISSALATNVRNDMASAPELAMIKLQNNVFAHHLSGDDINALEKEAVAAFEEKQSLDVAKARAAGFSVDHTLSAESFAAIKPILDRQGGADVILARINNSADTKKQSIALAQRQSESNFLNDSMYNALSTMDILSSSQYSDEQKAEAQKNLISIYSRLNQNGFSGKALGKLMTDTNDGVLEYAKLTDDMKSLRSTGLMYRDEAARQEYMALDAEKRKQNQLRKNDSARIGEMMELIDRGDYTDFRSFDFTGMHPMSVATVLDKMRSEYRYKKTEQLAAANGFDLKKQTSDAFKNISGIDAAHSPVLYDSFKKLFKDNLLGYYKQHNTFPTDVSELSRMAANAYGSMAEQDSVDLALMKTSQKAVAIRKNMLMDNKFVSFEDLIKSIADEMTDDAYDELDDNDKKDIAKQILSGNIYGATAFVKGSLQ